MDKIAQNLGLSAAAKEKLSDDLARAAQDLDIATMGKKYLSVKMALLDMKMEKLDKDLGEIEDKLSNHSTNNNNSKQMEPEMEPLQKQKEKILKKKEEYQRRLDDIYHLQFLKLHEIEVEKQALIKRAKEVEGIEG